MIRKLVLKRLGGAVVTLLLASIVIFLLVRLVLSDSVNLILGEGPGDMSLDAELLEEHKEVLREEHGLDDSIPIQYINWFKDIVTLDMETSIRSGRPITQELGSRISTAFPLALVALAVETGIGMLFGMCTAIHIGKFPDRMTRLLCIILASPPAFVLSLLFPLWFAIQLNWHEISSQMEWKRLWLPATASGLLGVLRCVRMVRATMLTELGQLYASASISRGFSKWVVIRGAFQNVLPPIITTITLSLAHMIGGSVVIETVFNWPGVGNYVINSTLVHDHSAVQGYTVLTVTTIISVDLLVETTYLLANPMIRRGGDASVVSN